LKQEAAVARTRISLIGEAYGCVAALFDGRPGPDGIEVAATRSPSPEAMRRQLTGWEFDVCEMAFGAYLIARAQGADVTAIPVFPRRAFFHTQFLVHERAGIAKPEDLNGKRIGVAEYVQSATLWARGILERDFGLDPRRVEWYVERAGADSTGAVLGFAPPADMAVRQTPDGRKVAQMLAAGELDAALVGSAFERVGASFPAGLRPLFPDVIVEGRRFHAAHGYVPANHLYMIRGALAREHPELVAGLYRGFRQASAEAQAALPSPAQTGRLFGNEYLAATCGPQGAAPFAYGIDANRGMLEDVLGLCRDQGLIRNPPRIGDMFANALD
jgi:4,5-dihydroxyphthalate decarboxylase